MDMTKCLPDHVIENILGYNDLSIDDIVSFRSYRKESDPTYEPWERIFFQRWPTAKKFYDKQHKKNENKDSEENEEENKKNLNLFIETGTNCARQLRDYVSRIIHKHYHKYNYDIDNLLQFQDIFHLDEYLTKKFDKIINNKSERHIKYFFFDEIQRLLKFCPRRTDCDLTERYCYEKIFHYIKQRSLRKQWLKFERLPNQLLEQAATIIAQSVQLQKIVFYSDIKKSLDNIALKVLDYLREKHPDHSIFSTSAETFSSWKNNNMKENYWNETEGTQIMDTLKEYIFGKLNFRFESTDFYNLEDYICIDNVLESKCGEQIIILIIYHSVARRLGLRCDVIKFNRYYSIFWKPKYATKGLTNARCFNVEKNCFVNTLPLLESQSSEFRERYKIKPIEVWCHIRYICQLIKGLPSTLFKINSNYYEGDVFKLRFNKLEHINTRLQDVKYAVGTIVEHRDRSTNCIGVIIAWHRYSDRHLIISRDLTSINIDTQLPVNICVLDLHFCHDSTYIQTNYVILSEHNKMCYVKEDNITLTTPKWIENSEIGRYFYKFEDTHYVPNQMLGSIFPQDAAKAK